MQLTSLLLLGVLGSYTIASSVLQVTKAASATFKNQCPFTVNVYDNQATCNLTQGSMDSPVYGCNQTIAPIAMFRHGSDPKATLAEFSIKDGNSWYDLSVIPPGSSEACTSYDECSRATNASGFNIGLMIYPTKHRDNSGRCRQIMCQEVEERCSDAYNFPRDDNKTFTCPDDEHFEVIFCP